MLQSNIVDQIVDKIFHIFYLLFYLKAPTVKTGSLIN